MRMRYRVRRGWPLAALCYGQKRIEKNGNDCESKEEAHEAGAMTCAAAAAKRGVG